jgi:hypothetical protein
LKEGKKRKEKKEFIPIAIFRGKKKKKKSSYL